MLLFHFVIVRFVLKSFVSRLSFPSIHLRRSVLVCICYVIYWLECAAHNMHNHVQAILQLKKKKQRCDKQRQQTGVIELHFILRCNDGGSNSCFARLPSSTSRLLLFFQVVCSITIPIATHSNCCVWWGKQKRIYSNDWLWSNYVTKNTTTIHYYFLSPKNRAKNSEKRK